MQAGLKAGGRDNGAPGLRPHYQAKLLWRVCLDPDGANIEAVCYEEECDAVFTIGYEGATVSEFLEALADAGVKRVIDVRAVPNSRRPGFSKTPLRNSLTEDGH